jgi:glucose-1-phosphate thymidylyltransferase
MASVNSSSKPEIIGLIPAAGHASRISPLPCSKEILPVGFRQIDNRGMRPKAICHYLLERMHAADIYKVFFVLRSGKWDIPEYLGNGSDINMNIGYLIANGSLGVAYTVDQAYPFVRNNLIAFGFPDILFYPEYVFKVLSNRQAQNNTDVVLGVVPYNQPQKSGMVDFNSNGKVKLIIEKPGEKCRLNHTWCCALWSPKFTEFLHHYLTVIELKKIEDSQNEGYSLRKELPIGDVIQAAINHGLTVEAEVFPDGSFLDIGSPEDLAQAIRSFASF